MVFRVIFKGKIGIETKKNFKNSTLFFTRLGSQFSKMWYTNFKSSQEISNI